MEFIDVVRDRRSVRAFKAQEVPADKLERVLEAARLAPSAVNRQAWKFIVVRDARRREQLATAANGQSHVKDAPVVIAGVALQPGGVMQCDVPTYAVDLGIAMEHIALAAANEGLGTCWIGAFSQSQVKRILGVPEQCKVAALMPLGYPAESPRPRPRKPMAEVVSYETFTE